MMTTAVAYPRLMPIDRCLHDFPTLTATVLPARTNDLEMAMTAPLPMSAFSTAGVGVRSLVKQHGHEKDYSGCYVLIDKEPIYVGISRSVVARLRQHVTGTTVRWSFRGSVRTARSGPGATHARLMAASTARFPNRASRI